MRENLHLTHCYLFSIYDVIVEWMAAISSGLISFLIKLHSYLVTYDVNVIRYAYLF